MEYGKGHIKIITRNNPDSPYDWSKEKSKNLASFEDTLATVTPINNAPSIRRTVISRTVVLLEPGLTEPR